MKLLPNTKEIKVCILTSIHLVFDTRIFHREAKTLAKAGYKVILITCHNKEEVIDGIRMVPSSFPKNRFFRFFINSLKIFKLAMKQKASVYHFHDPELILVGFFLKFFTKAKIIYDVHEEVSKDILSKEWIPKYLRRIISIIFDFCEKQMAKKFDCIIAATPYIAKTFKQEKVVLVSNYPILEYFKKTKNSSVKNGIYTIIYCGDMTRVRGIKEIVQALKFIHCKQGIKLKLIGRVALKNFETEIRNIKEWNKVECFAWMPHEENIKHLLDADCGLVCFQPAPNQINAMPRKMFEYMAASLPVIASNFSLWKEIIEGNKCGICVDPLNPKEIAKAIDYLIEHPQDARRMGENGRKAILEKYNWENESVKLLNLYDKLVR